MNSAQIQGGAIYIEAGVRLSIIVGNSTKLLLLNNSAFQGGALYTIPSFTVTVRYQSSVQFMNNNIAYDIGGAVYSQPAAPCVFMVTDYSAEMYFVENSAQQGVGHHMYGASVKSHKCDTKHISLVNAQGKTSLLGETRKS